MTELQGELGLRLEAFMCRNLLLITILMIDASGAGLPHSSQAPQTTAFKLFFILEGDNGKFGKKVGCGDSSVFIVKKVASTNTPLKAAFDELLAVKTEYYNGTDYLHSLHKSDLKVESATIKNKVATIKLTGKFISAGVCDDPRLRAQLNETALQFKEVARVKFYLNGNDLDKIGP